MWKYDTLYASEVEHSTVFQQLVQSASCDTSDLWGNEQIFKETISHFENQGTYFSKCFYDLCFFVRFYTITLHFFLSRFCYYYITSIHIINTSKTTNHTGFIKIGFPHQYKIIWYYVKNIKNLSSYKDFLNCVKFSLIKKLSDYVSPCALNCLENRSFKTSPEHFFIDTDIENVVEEKFSVLLTEEVSTCVLFSTCRGNGISLDGLMLAIYRFTSLGG